MTIRKGESIFYDFEKEGGDIIDDTKEGAIWQIRNQKNEILFNGDLLLNDNVLELRLGGTETTLLDPATYVLLVAFTNSDTDYKDYIFDEPLKVIK